jgi:hypothetical protein
MFSHILVCVSMLSITLWALPVHSQSNIMSEGEIRRLCVFGDCQNSFGILEIRTNVGTDRYEGNFSDSMFHGNGRFEQMISVTHRSYYDGEWNMGARDGRGAYWNGMSSLYIGQWRNDLRHGQGSYFFGLTDWVPNRHTEDWLRVNVENYTGNFIDDLYQGDGTFRWANGQNYVGTFFANEKHGPGTFFYANGTRREQVWEYGRFVR